ncbi:hypothetical protein [Psychromicrobium lacuslunae]|uniref:Lipoprotein n=1 Tax=Psychromicrobium lacuslunae TaxID=1618207 RepID=A0A0D4C0X8_9MICC|nr:hypothetical protein [Psychromicrobium lacuslunae]AJT42248.1 hypothetical protein UM93_13440 [Psychromicrobium lacuslunae]
MPITKIKPGLSRFSALTGVAAIAVFALVGCGGGGSTAPTSTSSEKTSASEQTSSSEESSSSEQSSSDRSPESTASESASNAPADTGKAGALTPPGTKLKVGQSANTHANTGKDPKDAKYKEATYTTTVTKIVAGGPADLSKFKDAAKYAGQTPYYVFADHKLTSLNKPGVGLSAPSLDAQLKDGTDAQKLLVIGSFDQCKTKSFETTGSGDTLSYQVGSVSTTCNIFLAPKGDAISSVSYDDPRFSYASYSDNQYRDNPIIWTK